MHFTVSHVCFVPIRVNTYDSRIHFSIINIYLVRKVFSEVIFILRRLVGRPIPLLVTEMNGSMKMASTPKLPRATWLLVRNNVRDSKFK